MKKSILLSLVVILSIPCFAQSFQWANSEPYSSYQTWTNKIIHDILGNTFISGNYNVSDSIFIVKYDSNGNKLWKKKYSGYGDIASLCSDNSSNFYVALFIDGPNVIIDGQLYDRSNGNNLFIKYDPNGIMQWIKQSKLGMLLSERTDQQDNIIVTGNIIDTVYLDNGITLSGSSNGDKLFLAKFNTNGECIWAQQNDGGNLYPLICNTNDDMFAVAEVNWSTSVGQGNNRVTLSPNNGDEYFAKYDSNGVLVWVKQAYTCGIAPDSQGNLYNFEPDRSDIPNGSFRNVYLIKYDPQGNILWKRTHLYIDDWYKFAMKTGSDGNLYMTGGFTNYMTIDGTTIPGNGNTRAFVIKIDSAGTVQWITTSSGAGGAGVKDITIANGNEIYITGDMAGVTSFGNYTVNQPNGGVFVAKIIDNGNVTGMNDTVTASFTANKIQLCTGDSVIFIDSSTGNATNWNWTFEGGTPTTSILQNPMVIYSQAGTYYSKLVVSNATKSDSVLVSSYISVNAAPVVHLGNDTIIADETTLILDAKNSGSQYDWSNGETSQIIAVGLDGTYSVIVIDQNGCIGTDEIKITTTFSTSIGANDYAALLVVYPNPASRIITVSITTQKAKENYSLKVNNSIGKTVYSETLKDISGSLSKQIDLSQLPKGIYFIELQSTSPNSSQKKAAVKKIVLQ